MTKTVFVKWKMSKFVLILNIHPYRSSIRCSISEENWNSKYPCRNSFYSLWVKIDHLYLLSYFSDTLLRSYSNNELNYELSIWNYGAIKCQHWEVAHSKALKLLIEKTKLPWKILNKSSNTVQNSVAFILLSLFSESL